jgi:hypothetical protein
MSKKKVNIKILVGGIVLLCVTITLSGCVSNQNASGDANTFLGEWTGNMEFPMFGGRNTSSTFISQLSFSGSTVEVTMSSDRGTIPMNYNYTINGNTLRLEPIFTGRGGFPGGQPPNGQWPQNGTRPGNDTWRPNGTRLGNDTFPPNGSRPPGGNQPSMNLSFTFSFNDQYNILYLNGVAFTKME